MLREEEYKIMVISCIGEEKENPLFVENVCAWWENIKRKIKTKSITLCKNGGIF